MRISGPTLHSRQRIYSTTKLNTKCEQVSRVKINRCSTHHPTAMAIQLRPHRHLPYKAATDIYDLPDSPQREQWTVFVQLDHQTRYCDLCILNAT